MGTNIIKITISGSTQVGKSAELAMIRDSLVRRDYCVAIADRAERKNPSDNLEDAEIHERPKVDETVFVLEEVNKP